MIDNIITSTFFSYLHQAYPDATEFPSSLTDWLQQDSIELLLSLMCAQDGTRDKVKALRSKFALCVLSTGNK